MRAPRRRAASRGSALILTIIATGLASAIALLMLSQSSANHTLAVHSSVETEAKRAAVNTIELINAHLEARIRSRPNLSPDEMVKWIAGLTLADETLTPENLGIDTSKYIANVRWTFVRINDRPPTTVDNHTPVITQLNAGLGTVMISDRAANAADVDQGRYIQELWSTPIRVLVQLESKATPTDNFTGRDAFSAVMQASLQTRRSSLLRTAMYFSAYTPFLWGGNNIYRGGIHSNKNAYFWASGSSEGARVQIERISAPGIYFRDYKTGIGAWGANAAVPGEFPDALLPGNNDRFNGTNNRVISGDGALNPQRQAIYISMGDRNGDGKVVGYGGASFQATSTSAPNTAGTEYRPAYRSEWDLGGTNQLDANNFWRTDNTYRDALTGQTKNYDSTYFRIDSDNPNIRTLSTLFNGNFKDNQTGYQSVSPAGLEALTDPHQVIEPPADAPTAPSAPLANRPLSAADDPIAFAEWAAYDSAKAAAANASAVEAAKLSTKSNFYVYVETTPRFTGDVVPKVTVFSSSKAATAYKKAIAAASDADMRAAVEAASAPNILTLPKGVINTTRRFIDYTQRQISASDTATPRVSAVDIDIGALRAAIGTADNPTTAITKADGSTWNPNDTTSGWNGVAYVDVDNPKGTGWSAAPPPVGMTAAPATDNANRTTENLTAVRIFNAADIPTRAGTPGYDRTDVTREGFSLATNTAVYTVGNINANGDPADDVSYGTSSGATEATAKEKTKGKEHHTAMAIACDSLIVMPGNHLDPLGTGVADLTNGDNVANTAGPGSAAGGSPIYTANTFTELNFAVLSGGVDPNKFNIPKHALQTYSPACAHSNGGTYRYRGSANQLFLAKYNTKWSQASHGTPYLGKIVDVGYDDNFPAGYTPPGIPSVLHFAPLNFMLLRQY